MDVDTGKVAPVAAAGLTSMSDPIGTVIHMELPTFEEIASDPRRCLSRLRDVRCDLEVAERAAIAGSARRPKAQRVKDNAERLHAEAMEGNMRLLAIHREVELERADRKRPR